MKELDREDVVKKTWWDCVENDMENLGLFQKMRSSEINGKRRIKGNWLIQVDLEKWPLKWSVCVCNKIVFS